MNITACRKLIAGLIAFMVGGLLMPGAAVRAASFDITFYGVGSAALLIQPNISGYTNIFTGTFDIANSALGIPNNLILFRDPAFLAFDAMCLIRSSKSLVTPSASG